MKCYLLNELSQILLCFCLIFLGAYGKVNENCSANKFQRSIRKQAAFEKNYGVMRDATRAAIKILQDMRNFSQSGHITLSYVCVVFLTDRVIMEVRWIGEGSLEKLADNKKMMNTIMNS